MQLANCIDKKRKLRFIRCLLLISTILLLSFSISSGLMKRLMYLVNCIPCIVLFVETAFLWETDEKHIGVFVFIISKIAETVFNIYTLVVFSRFGWLSVIFCIFIDLLVLATWGMNAYSFYVGFQKNLFERLNPKLILRLSLWLMLYNNIVMMFIYPYYYGFYNSVGFYAVLAPLPSLFTFVSLYSLFRDFTFAPMNGYTQSVKIELEQLQEAYDQGYLSEEVYQKRRQDIINRI